MEKVNVRIDSELGTELKKYLNDGYSILGVEMLKGFKQEPDIFFIALGPAPVVAAAPANAAGPVVARGPVVKVKDGQAEAAESQEPMPYTKRPIIAVHSPDPNKPTLFDVMDRIIAGHKASNKTGKDLADACIADIMVMKDPVTQTPLPSEVTNACQAYLTQELSK
jgi:hypothetical protein